MTEINVYRSLGMDLSDDRVTHKYAANVPKELDSHVKLDLTRCIIDYEATSIYIDAILVALSSLQTKEEKILEIIFNIKFQERLFLKWLFFGSNYLGLNHGTLSDGDIKEKVFLGLNRKKISLIIQIVTDQKSETLLQMRHD